jgi:predicted HicB family RNase H-like nuclease
VVVQLGIGREQVAVTRLTVNDYLQECQEKGLPPEKPASGKLLLRLAPELHGQAIVAAKAAGKSLNQWVAEALHRAVQTD